MESVVRSQFGLLFAFQVDGMLSGVGRLWSPSTSTLGLKEEVAGEMSVCGKAAVD